MLSRDRRLLLDTWNTSGLQEKVFQFSTFESPRDHCQRIHHSTRPGATGSVPVHIGTGTPVPDICKKAVDHKFIISGGHSAEFYGWTAKTAEIGTSICQIPHIFYILMLEDKILKPSDYLI